MTTAPRKVFNELPKSLQEVLDAGQSFNEIQQIFQIFLTQLETDLNRAGENPFIAARAFVLIEYFKAEFERFSKKVTSIQHFQATSVLPRLFEDAKIPEMPLNEGFKVEVKPKLFCSIKAANKSAAHEWLRENGLGDIIQPEVNPRTLTKAIHEHMQATAEEPPQEVITTFITSVATCRKGKGAKKLFDNHGSINIFGELLDS
jgi:hypothetical protein